MPLTAALSTASSLTSACSFCCLLLLPGALRNALVRARSLAGQGFHSASSSSSLSASSLLLLLLLRLIGLHRRWFWPPAPASRWPCVCCQTHQHISSLSQTTHGVTVHTATYKAGKADPGKAVDTKPACGSTRAAEIMFLRQSVCDPQLLTGRFSVCGGAFSPLQKGQSLRRRAAHAAMQSEHIMCAASSGAPQPNSNRTLCSLKQTPHSLSSTTGCCVAMRYTDCRTQTESRAS
jgi:hypothetical protein